MTPTRITAWLAGLFGIISLWLLLRMGGTDVIRKPSAAVFMAGLSLWLLSPYAILAAAARFGKFRTVTWGAPAVLVIVGFYGNLAYADVNFHFASKSDAQDALVFLVLPFVQNVVAVGSMGVLLAIGYWLARRKEKGTDCSAP
jgi:uncharacterized protein YacL